MATNKHSLEQRIEIALRMAKQNAFAATQTYFTEQLNGVDQYPCGFAWIFTIEHGNSSLVKILKKHDFYKRPSIGYALWNPSGCSIQNMDALYTGARAAAETLTELLGVKFYAECRMD